MKRYCLYTKHGQPIGQEWADGDWCKWEDVDKLVAEKEAWELRHKSVWKMLNELEEKYSDLHKYCTSLKQANDIRQAENEKLHNQILDTGPMPPCVSLPGT